MFCFDILIPEFNICHLGFRCCIETCIVGIYKCKDKGFDELTTHFGSTAVDIPSKHEVCPVSLHSALRQCLPSLHLSRGQRYRVHVSMFTHSAPIRFLVGYRSCAEFRQNKKGRETPTEQESERGFNWYQSEGNKSTCFRPVRCIWSGAMPF